jgi:imidazolonepropionase-like amidohydrolase
MNVRATLFAGMLAVGSLGTGRAAWAWPQEEQAKGEAAEAGDEAEAAVDDDEDGEERWYAIVGGDVHTGLGGVLRGATVLARNGRIREIGRDLVLPEGTEVLDASGLRVYPGLVALDATSRISGGLSGPTPEDEAAEQGIDLHHGLERGSEGGVEDEVEAGVEGVLDSLHLPVTSDDDPAQAELGLRSEIEDTFDPFSQYLVLALATGITTAEQQNAAVKLKRGELEGLLLSDKFQTPIVWSLSNPSSIQNAREKFAKAAEYLRQLRAHEALPEKERKEKKEPSKKGVDPGFLSVLEGKTVARFNANQREELIGIARLAQEYRFRPVILGCQEGWTVAEELGRAGAYAVVTPRDRAPKDETLVRPGGTSIENAAILWRSGVQVAIRPSSTAFDLGGITGRDLLALTVEAGFGVRGGLSEDAALQAITIVPARLLGCDHRIGTLEIGKDLDAIVTDGDLLHYQTFVQYAVVDGKLVYDKEKEIFFAHIRPRPKKAVETPAPAAEPTDEPKPEEQVESGESEDDEPDEEEDEEGTTQDDDGS